MDFAIWFYETVDGGCPVRDFLEELKRTNPDDHQAVLAGLNKLKNGQNHREPLSKPLRDGLLELRHVGKLNTRIIWFFREGRRIILVHGIRNKSQKISGADFDTAMRRMKDWNRRNGK